MDQDTRPGNSWQVEIDRATPEQWEELLDLFDDANIYQTAAYGAVRWGEKNLSRLVLKRAGEVAAIAQVRIIRPTPLRFGMAYLRWGPLCARRGRPVDAEVFSRMARALEEEYAEKRGLFLSILPNAFAGSSRAEIVRSAFARFSPDAHNEMGFYRTIVLDLAPTAEQLRKNLEPKWRNKLSGAERNGLSVVTKSGSDGYRIFREMYDEMQQRKAFETTVDVEEFGRIQAALPERHRMSVLICESKGAPVAGVVVSAMGDSAIYLLGATSDEGLKSKGAYLLHWSVILSLREIGIRWYDLGGIDPEENPGVYYFKRGFSGLDVTHIHPLVACNNGVSATMVKTGLAVRRLVNGTRGVWNTRKVQGKTSANSQARA